MADTTVAREIFKKLREFEGYVCSGDMEHWNCLNATGSTITRKARMLHPQYALVDYRGDKKIAWYKARRSKEEQCPCEKCNVAPEPLQAPTEPIKPKVEYFITHPVTGERVKVV